MKKLLFAFFSLAVVTAQAQTVDDVIQKYTSAMGGLDAFNKVTSAKMTATVTVQGNDLPLTTQIINGKAMRTDVDVMGQSITNVYYNGKGWKINPFAGATTATEVTGAELNDFKAQASLVNHLMDYKARGHKVELLGQEDVDGIKTFKINLTSKDDGKITTFFINTTDYMLNKSIAKQDMMGQEAEVETYYTDIKDVNGLKFSMTRTKKIGGQDFQLIKFDKIELNVPIDEKIFAMPK